MISVKSLDVNYHSEEYDYLSDNIHNKSIYEKLIYVTTLINSIEKK